MAGYNRSAYQYETSPRKLKPEYKPKQKKYPKKGTTQRKKVSTTQKLKIKNKSNVRVMLTIGSVFAILFAVSYQNALVAQRYSELKKLKTNLSVIEKENKQLEVNIESKTNLSAIEEKATNELGLKKLDKSQIIYVAGDKQDYIKSSIEEIKMPEQGNWFTKIIQKIKTIF